MNTNLNPLTTNKIVRARAYVRVSLVGDRKDTLLSDKVQLDDAKRYAEFCGFGFDAAASVANADLSVSGFRKPWRTRPGLMAHYEAAKRGEYDALIFFKISRLARNVREALDMIDAFEKVGVSFHFVAERIDSSSAQGRFLRNVLLSAAEMQSEDISEFLKSTVARRAREGRLQGATPVWIRKVGKEREGGVRYELIPDQVENVRRLIELRLQGTGYDKIAQRLNEEGRRTVQGKYWTGGMAFKYLRPDYIETMLGTGFYGRDTSEPLRIPNAFPAILTQAEADRVLAVQKLYSEEFGRKPIQGLDWMKNKRNNGRYSASSAHLLSSILFCPHCGARMVPHQRGSKAEGTQAFRYVCPRRVSSRDIHPSGMTMVHAPSLEDAVLRVLRGVLTRPLELPKTKKPRAQAEGLEAIQTKIDRLVNLHLDGKIGETDFNRVYAELAFEKERMQIAAVGNVPHEHHAQAVELVAKSELTRAQLRQLVLLMVERIEAPVQIEGVTIRVDRKTLRRLARITLRFPTVDGDMEFLAAIYDRDFEGIRRFVPVKPGDTGNLRDLIGERPYERLR